MLRLSRPALLFRSTSMPCTARTAPFGHSVDDRSRRLCMHAIRCERMQKRSPATACHTATAALPSTTALDVNGLTRPARARSNLPVLLLTCTPSSNELSRRTCRAIVCAAQCACPGRVHVLHRARSLVFSLSLVYFTMRFSPRLSYEHHGRAGRISTFCRSW